MTDILRPDLCVLGGGAGGIAAASAAAAAGATVVLVENRHPDEGYPTAALTAHVLIDVARKLAAHRADAIFGLPSFKSTADIAAVRLRVQKLAARQMVDTPARLAALNITRITGTGRFTRPDRLETAGALIEAKRFVVASGADSPPRPVVKGFDLVRPLALDALLQLDAWPKRIAMLGATPVGLALAQALRRLGSDVHLLDEGRFLPDEDEELVMPIINQLRRDGVALHESTELSEVEPRPAGLYVDARQSDGGVLHIDATHLMLASAPVPRVDGLGLEAARVAFDKKGIKVRSDLRTTNPRIYAIGDVLGGVQSYANARYQAHRVVEHIFRGEYRYEAPAPRLVFTDPELAVVGLSEAQARKSAGDIHVLRGRFHDNLTAQIIGDCEGQVKIITDKKDRVLGAGICGPQARELIGLFSLALSQRLHAGDLKGFVPASPSLTEAGRLAALALPSQFGRALWQRIFPLPRRFW